MAVGQNSKWLAWFCNFSGLLPFRMIQHNDQLVSFEFQWKHPISWWFTLVNAAQLIYLIIFCIDLFHFSNETELVVPTNFKLATIAMAASMLILILSLHLILFHLRKLQIALESLQYVDLILDKLLPHWTCTTRRRTALGIFISFLMVR